MEFSFNNDPIDKNGQNSTRTTTAKTLSLDPSSKATAHEKTASSSAPERVGHRLELDHERALSMTGVRDVPVFTDKNITVRLDNETLFIIGQNLAVKSLDVESGKLQISGRVFSLRYTAQAAPKSLMKRIFK